MIQAQKFYKTLSLRLDREEQRWHDAQPKTPVTEFIEHPPNGSIAQKLLGGALQIRHKFFKSDDNRKV